MAWQFDGDMKKVAKSAQNATKSNGIVAGALVLLVGTMAAAVDAVQLYDVLVSEYERKHGVIKSAPDAFSREDRIKDLIKEMERQDKLSRRSFIDSIDFIDSIEKYLKH
jgi:hypothetical protein